MSIAGRQGLGEQGRRASIRLTRQSFVVGITLPWRDQMFGGGRTNVMNRMWMKIVNKLLISLIPVEDMGE
jgi:hypothetical protein